MNPIRVTFCVFNLLNITLDASGCDNRGLHLFVPHALREASYREGKKRGAVSHLAAQPLSDRVLYDVGLLLSCRGGTSGEEDACGEAGKVLPAIEQHGLITRHIEAVDGIGLVVRTKAEEGIHIDVTRGRIDLDGIVGLGMIRIEGLLDIHHQLRLSGGEEVTVDLLPQ